MSNLRNASLVLKTMDLTANSITSIGESNQFMTKMTWYNINLRTLLGDMYNDYERFNICLNTFTTAVIGSGGPVGASTDDKIVLLKVAGLPWLNQSYDVAKGHNTNATYLGSLNFVAGSYTPQLFFSSNLATFGKSQELVNITISYERLLDGILPNTVNPFPSSVFIFDIIGVDNYSTKNASRLDNGNLLY